MIEEDAWAVFIHGILGSCKRALSRAKSTSYANTMGHSVNRLNPYNLTQQSNDQMNVLQNLSLKNAIIQKANMQASRRL